MGSMCPSQLPNTKRSKTLGWSEGTYWVSFQPVLVPIFTHEAVATDDTKKWAAAHKRFRLEKKIGGCQPWSDAKRPMRGAKTARAKDAINICAALRPEAFNPASSLILDLSQNAHRSPWSIGVRSITTSSDLFSFDLGRTLTGSEHFKLLGFPDVQLGKLSQRQMKHLVGEAMSPPAVGSVLLALLLSLDGFFEHPRPKST
eukprot:119700-Amphidinium_carterae.1